MIIDNNIFNGLTYCCITVTFKVMEKIHMNHWIGAVFRNRFLYCADNIYDDYGIPLRKLLDECPLDDQHFLYSQVAGGFPKGYLFKYPDILCQSNDFELIPDKEYSFTIVLVGKLMAYCHLFIETAATLCKKGIGYPMTELHIIDINVDNPISYADRQNFCRSDNVNRETTVKIRFNTPVNLYSASSTISNGYQNKLNNMPTFYQFIRSVAYRLTTLNILYCNEDCFHDKDEMDIYIDEFTNCASQAKLLEAQLKFVTRLSTPKKGKSSLYRFSGYTGHFTFDNVDDKLYRLLLFAEKLGVGANINYGLGCYTVYSIKA